MFFCDAGHVLTSRSYLASIPALVLIGKWSFRFGFNIGYKSWSYKHPHRIARVCRLLYTFRISELNMFLFLVKQYHQYVVKSILTDATLTLEFRMIYVGNVHIYR